MSPILFAADHNTMTLLANMLLQFQQGKESVCVLIRAGEGRSLEARIRMMLSRKRAKVKQQGKRVKHFTLKCDHFPWTQDGVRYDCVKFTHVVRLTHTTQTILENLLNG